MRETYLHQGPISSGLHTYKILYYTIAQNQRVNHP